MGQWCNISFVLALIFISCVRLSKAELGEGSTPEDFVNTHNCMRRVLNLPPLTWDDKIAKVAQAYANKRKDCQLIHSEGSGYGENLGVGPKLNGLWSTQMWIDERPDYDYATNQCLAMCGHYTQVVWKKTERIGCGVAKCDDGSDFNMVVCNYDPPGNYQGQWPY
ncbi:pathogenesis-related protein PR-1 type-like [Bidens hawaiensis]|uniref:pathogenesis-related protein PR-1 type-like n=1 Tax=Bidens hawaiensis TaxID=980011 RepID=UPI00404AC80A